MSLSRRFEHPLAIQLRRPVQAGLRVHRAFGRAGRAAGVQPEGRLVAVGVGALGPRLGCELRRQLVGLARQGLGGPRHQEVLDFVALPSMAVCSTGSKAAETSAAWARLLVSM